MQKSKWFCLKTCFWSKTTHMNLNRTGIFKFGSPWTGETSLLISPSFSLLNGGSGLACVCTKKLDNLNKMHMHTFFDIRTAHLRQNYWGLTISFFHYRQKCNHTLSVRAVCFETVTSFDLCWISTFL